MYNVILLTIIIYVGQLLKPNEGFDIALPRQVTHHGRVEGADNSNRHDCCPYRKPSHCET